MMQCAICKMVSENDDDFKPLRMGEKMHLYYLCKLCFDKETHAVV